MLEISNNMVTSEEISFDINQESDYGIVEHGIQNLQDDILVYGHVMKRLNVKPHLRSSFRTVIKRVHFAPEVVNRERTTLAAVRPVKVRTYSAESGGKKSEWDLHSAIIRRVACLRASLTYYIVSGTLAEPFCFDTCEQI